MNEPIFQRGGIIRLLIVFLTVVIAFLLRQGLASFRDLPFPVFALICVCFTGACLLIAYLLDKRRGR